MSHDPTPSNGTASGWTEAASGLFILLWGMAGVAGLLWRPAIWQDDYGLDPGPGLLPLIVIACLLLGGTALLIRGAVRIARHPRDTGKANFRKEVEPTLVAMALLASVVLYVLALKIIGFFAATLVFAAAWITVIYLRDGATSIVRTVIIAVAAAAAIAASVYLVFQRLIGVPLP